MCVEFTVCNISVVFLRHSVVAATIVWNCNHVGHLVHRFGITERDWHRIKLNIDSKCRTAFRRKIRGQPLTVKAFRGKTESVYVHVGQPVQEDSDEDTNSMQATADSVLQINEVWPLDLIVVEMILYADQNSIRNSKDYSSTRLNSVVVVNFGFGTCLPKITTMYFN